MLVAHVNKNFLRTLARSQTFCNITVGVGRAFDPIPPSIEVPETAHLAVRPMVSDLFCIYTDKHTVETQLVAHEISYGKIAPTE